MIRSPPPQCYASSMPCTCPPSATGHQVISRDPRCPEHGLHTLRIPDLLPFTYEDGIRVHAENQAAADEMHAAMAARRRQPPKA